MKLRFIVALVAAFLLTGTNGAQAKKIYYGAWTQGYAGSCEGYPYSQFGHFYKMLKDTLGFNVIIGTAVSQRADSLAYYGLTAVGGQYQDNDGCYPQMYAQSTYSVFEAEGVPYADSLWGLHRKLQYPSGTLEGGYAKFTQGVTTPGKVQWGPYLIQKKKYPYNPWPDQWVNYKSDWKIKVGVDPTPATMDTIAKFAVVYGDSGYNGQSWDTLVTYYLTDNMFSSSGVDTTLDSICIYRYNQHFAGGCADALCRTDSLMQLLIFWYGKRDLWIDRVAIYDDHGKELVETPAAARVRIQEYYDGFTAAGLAAIKQWWLAEEYNQDDADMFLPIRTVDSLTRSMTPSIEGYVLLTDPTIAAYVNADGYDTEPYSFHGRSPEYLPTAFSTDPPYSDSTSLQVAMSSMISTYSDWNTWAKARGKYWTTSVQGFSGTGTVDPSIVKWRRPTANELLCSINLALAYDCTKMWFWKYTWSQYPDYTYEGLLDRTGNRTPSYYALRDTVSPQINALIPHLENLTWQSAWKYGETPPADNDLDTITCNEYGGSFYDGPFYLQVAHFLPPAGDPSHYYFLTNRRCLPSESISGKIFFPQLTGAREGWVDYWIKDMVSGDNVKAQFNQYCCNHEPPFGFWFTYSIPPGGAKLYRISPEGPCTLCGDADGNNTINISNVVFLIGFVFNGTPVPGDCNYTYGLGDADGNKVVNISDAVALIGYVFNGTPVPHCNGT